MALNFFTTLKEQTQSQLDDYISSYEQRTKSAFHTAVKIEQQQSPLESYFNLTQLASPQSVSQQSYNLPHLQSSVPAKSFQFKSPTGGDLSFKKFVELSTLLPTTSTMTPKLGQSGVSSFSQSHSNYRAASTQLYNQSYQPQQFSAGLTLQQQEEIQRQIERIATLVDYDISDYLPTSIDRSGGSLKNPAKTFQSVQIQTQFEIASPQLHSRPSQLNHQINVNHTESQEIKSTSEFNYLKDENVNQFEIKEQVKQTRQNLDNKVEAQNLVTPPQVKKQVKSSQSQNLEERVVKIQRWFRQKLLKVTLKQSEIENDTRMHMEELQTCADFVYPSDYDCSEMSELVESDQWQLCEIVQQF